MQTKKNRKRHLIRRLRRVLKGTSDLITKSSRKHIFCGYKSGVNKQSF